ncbi:NAD-dependent succinate-semialdehyde dehydrogenase [Phyllobacterium sp. SB3]|uniref:NAD-dependent succinate-semialdehyde dehydrogenase n=1 Tax=Phyllobacterium sp. SB3 TaxID=3156073 RepID=UPI0032AE9085
MSEDVLLYINGEWKAGGAGKLPIINPATEEQIGTVAHASHADLDIALEAADRAFRQWRDVSALDRSKVLRQAAKLMRERQEDIARIMTIEQGKPLAESRIECAASADLFDWFAEEARRTYGRVIPARAVGVSQTMTKEPVGPVAAFTPWNFPLSQTARKIGAALAAGCSIIVKGPEETPASVAELVRSFADAELPAGVLNLVFGVPADISSYLIPHPIIRKISFTGSTAIGKELASLAGRHMKRSTMELGGHAPAIVFADADINVAANLLCGAKYRNAGQVCVSPTRMMVQESVYEQFIDLFVEGAKKVKVGNGLDADTAMGPLAHGRRVEAMESFVADAVAKGANLRTGGSRAANKGYFFQPTVVTDLSGDARLMNEEPFGPIALISSFRTFDDAIAEANRLPYGLSAYAYTKSAETAARVSSSIESGMISINHHGLGLAETPFGGVKDSGYGSEGGVEAIEAYLVTKFVSHRYA